MEYNENVNEKKMHIKDIFCLSRECGMKTKNVEIRHCDDFLEIMSKVPELHTKYYGV